MRNFIKTVSILNISFSIPVFVAVVLIFLFTIFASLFAMGMSNTHTISFQFILVFIIEILIALWLIFSVITSFAQAINIEADSWNTSFLLTFINFIACGCILLFFLISIATNHMYAKFDTFFTIVGSISTLPLFLMLRK